MITFFDTETTHKKPEQARIVSISYIAFSDDGTQELHMAHTIVKPDNFIIPEETIRIHGITNEIAQAVGIDARAAIIPFMHIVARSTYVMAFNRHYDTTALEHEAQFYPEIPISTLNSARQRCVMLAAAQAMKLPNAYGYESYAWPKLAQAYTWLFQQAMEGAHNSLADTRAAAWVAFGLRDAGLWDFETERC